MSSKLSDVNLDDLSDIDITLMTLRKPTELKKVIDSIPKPVRAVPKHGLPQWYRLGLECKLPVPKIPKGKILFSRGIIGEDVRRLGLGDDGPQPGFDLTDPYCRNVSYEYVPLHDPHLTHYFTQKQTRNQMKKLGYCIKDGRAVCSLKEFNQYRKYLYNKFMDRMHQEMQRLDERARDDLTIKRVEVDVVRRSLAFTRAEKTRKHLEKIAQEHAAEWAEKKRLAKERENKIIARMKYLAELNEHQRKERAAKSLENQNRIKQRVLAAAELELRRKITMVRQWRENEKNRLNRLKKEREAMLRKKEEDENNKWAARVSAHNQKIKEEALLLKVYSEDMSAAARRRIKKSEIYAYNTDLELQRIRIVNWKMTHGGKTNVAKLVKKIGKAIERTKNTEPKLAQQLAAEAMSQAISTNGDALTTLGEVRKLINNATDLPSAPIKLLDEGSEAKELVAHLGRRLKEKGRDPRSGWFLVQHISLAIQRGNAASIMGTFTQGTILEFAVTEFARSRVYIMLLDVERTVHSRAANVFFQNYRPYAKRGDKKVPRWSAQIASELAKQYAHTHRGSITFGKVQVTMITNANGDHGTKSVKNRPPTPVPSKTDLVEVAFTGDVGNLPDPVAFGNNLPERRILLEMVSAAGKLLSRSVSTRVQKGMDITIGSVTLPHMKHRMDWGEAVEGLSDAVLNNRINADCADLRQVSEFLAQRILRALLAQMKEEKKIWRCGASISSEVQEMTSTPKQSR